MKRSALLLSACILVVIAGVAWWAAATEPASPSNPLQGEASRATLRLEGRVVERLPAGMYLYLRVRSGEVEHWVVTLGATAPPPADVQVQIEGFARARDFHSRRLNRVFDDLWFGSVRAVPSLSTVVPTQKGKP